MKAKAARLQRTSSAATSENTTLISMDSSANSSNTQSITHRFQCFIKEASVYLIHNALGYALMLTVMIYNGFLFIAVVLGMSVGYFIFGHISMRINMENVQARKTTVICTKGVNNGGNDSGSSNSGKMINILMVLLFI